MSQSIPPWAQNVLLSVMSAVVSVGTIEGVCRILEPRQKEPAVVKGVSDWTEWDDDFYTVAGWSSSGRYNLDGLRDRQHAVVRASGVRRIMCLGDSTTFGQHLRPEQAYPQVLQQILDARAWGFEVFNVALPGWSARQELVAYRRICRKYSPNQIVLGICLNDIPEMQNNLSRPPAVVTWLHRRSALVRRVVNARGREIRDVRALFGPEPHPGVREGYERLFAEIRALRDEARADGATLAVFVFPFRFQLLPDAPLPTPQQAIAAFCQAERIPLFDPLPAFQRMGAEAFVDDDHPTAAGARLIAEQLVASGSIVGAQAETPNADQPASLAALVAALSSRDARERLHAAHSLGNQGPRAAHAVAELARMLADPSPDLRAAGARSLGQVGPEAKEAGAALVKSLDDDDESVRLHAADALAMIQPDPDACLPGLVRILEDPISPGRGAAARVVGQMGPAARLAVPALTAALRDRREEVRARSVWALGEIGPEASFAAHALIDALADPSLRWRVVDTLGRIGPGGRAAVPALTAALKDESGDVRRLAARALGRIGPPARSSSAVLIEALEDNRADVRLAAVRALIRIQADRNMVVPALERLLEDPAVAVRREAGRALAALPRR